MFDLDPLAVLAALVALILGVPIGADTGIAIRRWLKLRRERRGQ